MSWHALIGWLTNPLALMLLAGLPLLGVLAVLAWRERRRRLRLVSQMPFAPALGGRRLIRGLLVGGGLLLIGIAVAGPRWGREKTETLSPARDLVVLLDCSRSMLAETPSRQVRARRVLADLASTLKQRGGHRVALVAVAARAQLVVPLTTDYDLFRDAVAQQDAARLPAELRPGKDGPMSGTRLGEGLEQALAAHDPDPTFRGSQVILLVSDGDDPAGDGEWKLGVDAARRASTPVFVVGVGDPTRPSKIRMGDTLLSHAGQPVVTTLNEAVLKEIASQTDGNYFPVRTDNVVPGSLFPALLEAAAARPRPAPAIDQYRPRFRWFLVPGMLLLAGSMLVRDRKTPRNTRGEATAAGNPQSIWLSTRPRSWSAAAVLASIAVTLAGAAPQVKDVLRQGNDAFKRKDYAAALKLYERAEEQAPDPGLVAFNKGATLYRLGRLREAELSYLRCLQDRDAPVQRRQQALFDLGTVLLQRGAEQKDLEVLNRAGEAFELCRQEAIHDKELRDDAEYNLELARLLFLKVRAEMLASGEKGKDPQGPGAAKENKQKDTKPGGNLDGQDTALGKNELAVENPLNGAEPTPKLPGAGNVQALADTTELQALDGIDAREMLARAVERIQHEQTRAGGANNSENPGVKEW